MWSRCESVALVFTASHSGALSCSSALHCLKKRRKRRKLLLRDPFCSATGRGAQKTQVPKAIIKLPKPFLLLFNLFVANPAIRTLNVALYRGNYYSGFSEGKRKTQN